MQEMKPELKTSKDGNKTLIVYYTGTGWDEAIEAAERRFNVLDDHTITIIALPESSMFNDFNKTPTGAKITGERPTADRELVRHAFNRLNTYKYYSKNKGTL